MIWEQTLCCNRRKVLLHKDFIQTCNIRRRFFGEGAPTVG